MRRRRVRMFSGWFLIAVGVAFIADGLITGRHALSLLLVTVVFGLICIAFGLLRLWEARRGKAFLAIRLPPIPAPRTLPATVLRMALIAVGGAVVTILFYFSDLALYHSQGFALITAVAFALLTVAAIVAQPVRYTRQKHANAG